MKRIAILFFAHLSAFSAYSQTNFQDGDRCFDSGDYACAITSYNQAFKLASGKDKQIAEIKLTRAKFCQEQVKTANQAFASKQYSTAKNGYQNVLESNPKDSYAQSQLEKCDSALNPIATLSVSEEFLSFSASGGSENITVTTNENSYSVNMLISWCRVQKYSGYFVISCSPNSSTNVRNDYFTVIAGDKTVRINVSQLGKEQETKTETTLSVTKSSLWFPSSGGRSESIAIYSNDPTYSVSLVPAWVKVETNNGYIVVVCTANNNSAMRSDWFNVIAGEKEIKISINQAGVAYNNASVQLNDVAPNNESYSQTKTKRPFNSPKTKDTWGLTWAYANYDFGQGLQFGVKAEPLFQYGFGLNTGINLEGYASDVWGAFSEWEFDEYAVNIPLHLEYRLNFSKWFNIFLYGGAGFYTVTDADFKNHSLPVTFDFGGGFRISHVQFNVGKSLYLGDLRNTQNFGKDTEPYQRSILSVSYMF